MTTHTVDPATLIFCVGHKPAWEKTATWFPPVLGDVGIFGTITKWTSGGNFLLNFYTAAFGNPIPCEQVRLQNPDGKIAWSAEEVDEWTVFVDLLDVIQAVRQGATQLVLVLGEPLRLPTISRCGH